MILYSDKEGRDDVDRSYGPVYNLTSLSTPCARQDEKLIHVLKEAISIYTTPKTKRSPPPITTSRRALGQQFSYLDLEKQLLLEENESYSLSQHRSRPKREISVTWTHILAENHRNRKACNLNRGNTSVGTQDRTDAAASIRQWNWDFLPSDQLKPLATSTLNIVIPLALRLNMQWRRFHLLHDVGASHRPAQDEIVKKAWWEPSNDLIILLVLICATHWLSDLIPLFLRLEKVILLSHHYIVLRADLPCLRL